MALLTFFALEARLVSDRRPRKRGSAPRMRSRSVFICVNPGPSAGTIFLRVHSCSFAVWVAAGAGPNNSGGAP